MSLALALCVLIPNTENVGAEKNRFFVFDDVGDEPGGVGSGTEQDVDPVQDPAISSGPSGGVDPESLPLSVGGAISLLGLATR